MVSDAFRQKPEKFIKNLFAYADLEFEPWVLHWIALLLHKDYFLNFYLDNNYKATKKLTFSKLP